MPKITKVEHARRLRAVQEWLIQDWPHCDIEAQCVTKYVISERQAKRYIKEAMETWKAGNQEKLDAKRARRIESLKKLKRDIDIKFKNTPAGIRAILQIEKELIKLEGVTPTEQMIEAEAAVQKGKQADPLSPSSSRLIIEVTRPYADT